MSDTAAESPDRKQGEKRLEQIRQAIAGDVPKMYANGFVISLGNADIQVLLQLGGQPISVVFMSYTVAKTLVEKLGIMVKTLEKCTKQNILTTDRAQEALSKGKNAE